MAQVTWLKGQLPGRLGYVAMIENLGRVIVGVGILLVIAGLGLWLAGDRLSWFGRLPGDIRLERPGFSCFLPITTMIIVSIVLSVVLSLLSRFFK
ncbi:MAG: DUF2905 domain-containing protein [Chloroflexota bacterium]